MNAPCRIIADPGPVPPIRRGSRPIKYPFAQMAVGQAFDVPRCGKRDSDHGCLTQRNVSSCANQWRKRHNPSAKFTVRVIDEHTVRCWRIA